MSETYFVLEKMPPGTAVFSSPDGKRVFRKELVYADNFKKGDQRIPIDSVRMSNWVENFKRFQEVGISVPLQKEHTNDPEECRGELVGLELGINEKGKKALYGFLTFRDEEAEKLALTAQVSIFAQDEFEDGKGNKYTDVLRHVALTNNPVIPGLGKFESIAASFDSGQQKGTEMSISLAKALGLEIPEGADDAKMSEQISLEFKKMKDEIETLKGKKEETPDPEKKKEDEIRKEVAASFTKKLAKSAASSRKDLILSLVKSGKITKAVATKLEKAYCEPDTIALSLDDEGDVKDSFEATFDALKENETILSFSEDTGHQKYSKDSENPMVREAEARANASKK